MEAATLFGIDYPTLWFMVVGGLFSGYAILDGFDFGAGAWHLFFRKEQSRTNGGGFCRFRTIVLPCLQNLSDC